LAAQALTATPAAAAAAAVVKVLLVLTTTAPAAAPADGVELAAALMHQQDPGLLQS
jgi:hypothetical protein